MELEEKIILAKSDSSLREEIIHDYVNFIKARASEAAGKSVTESDDDFSVAMIAFNEAIDSYKEDKGKFLSFSSVVIRNKVLNHIRSERKHHRIIPFSSLSATDKDGDVKEFDVADTKSEINDAAVEIKAVTQELKGLNISFFDLPEVSPKSKKTKTACSLIIRYILSEPALVKNIKTKGILPLKQIKDNLKVNDKVLERHRKYIISAVIILSGKYEILSEYLSFVKEGEK